MTVVKTNSLKLLLRLGCFCFNVFVFCLLGFGVLRISGLHVVGLGVSGVLMRMLVVPAVACRVLGSWLFVFGVSCFFMIVCFCALGFWLFGGSGFAGLGAQFLKFWGSEVHACSGE